MPILAFAFAGVISLILPLYLAIWFLSHSPRRPFASEQKYIAPKPGGGWTAPTSLPTLKDAPTRAISIVIPCYNEQKRLPSMLDEAVPYLQEKFGRDWEILFVDDGSKDDTSTVALKWAADQNLSEENVRLVRLVRNRGKGGAVTHGMKHARGRLILFADADGASRFSDLSKLTMAVQKGAGVALGSRAHLVKSEAVVKRTFIRNFLMYALHTLLYIFGIRDISDTQCGFKLFTHDVAGKIFPYMHTERWIFDVEVLMLAKRKHIPIAEIPISWHEVEGSKIDLARDSILMAVDLVVLRLAYLLGIYDDGSAASKKLR